MIPLLLLDDVQQMSGPPRAPKKQPAVERIGCDDGLVVNVLTLM